MKYDDYTITTHSHVKLFYHTGETVLLDEAMLITQDKTGYLKSINFDLNDIIFNDQTQIHTLLYYHDFLPTVLRLFFINRGLEKIQYANAYHLLTEVQIPLELNRPTSYLNQLENVQINDSSISIGFGFTPKHPVSVMSHRASNQELAHVIRSMAIDRMSSLNTERATITSNFLLQAINLTERYDPNFNELSKKFAKTNLNLSELYNEIQLLVAQIGQLPPDSADDELIHILDELAKRK